MHPSKPVVPSWLACPGRARVPHRLATWALAGSCGLATCAQAGWVARDLDGNTSTVEAFYDSSSNLTWLNHSAGLFWTIGDAIVWAAGLNTGGVSGWRLPSVANTLVGTYDPTDPQAQHSNPDPALSELAYLYRSTLGNKPASIWDPVAQTYQVVPGGGWVNQGGLNQIDPNARYYGLTAAPNNITKQWLFHFDTGAQSMEPMGTVANANALVVHDGDVGAPIFTPGPPVLSPAVPHNVALNRPVQVIDPDGELGNNGGWGGEVLAPASTLTDGVHLAEGNTWQTNTLFWTETNGSGSFAARVQLDGLYSVSRLTLQADNNDGYLVRYQGADGAWRDLTEMGVSCCFGMATRDVTVAPVVASAFEIVGHDGDGLYSMSEFQAFGVSAVPEPQSWALMALGCAVLAGRRRRLRLAPSSAGSA